MIILSQQDKKEAKKVFENLRKIRQERNIKAKEIAEKLGLKTEGAYYKKETGSVPFTLTEGKIVSEIIGLPIEEIFFTNELSCEDKR
jgi:transcriptional regulator with XRE-family HTH domain